jgi:DNA-binding NtrC family response regulator
MIKAACRLVRRLSRYDVPVLLEGETGTGKELFSRALHYLGPRRSKPFVPVNCGALPDNLFENELFGHVSGAYTDARGESRGLVAQAEGGTLLLDEVHCLSAKGQVALLRFVQDHSYRPLGATSARRADVRLLAATNQSLPERVAEGTFREDLHHRLNVGQLHLPPLRARKDDVPLLVDNILARLSARHGTGRRRCSATSLSWLKAQSWPGNVRELENLVHRAFLMSDADVIQLEPTTAREPAAASASVAREEFRAARSAVLTDFEARYVRAQLAETGGNVSAAALRAGKDRRVFGRLMRKHGIDRREFDTL